MNKSTGISKTGTATWTLTFKKGTHRLVCDAHPTLMRGSFERDGLHWPHRDGLKWPQPPSVSLFFYTGLSARTQSTARSSTLAC